MKIDFLALSQKSLLGGLGGLGGWGLIAFLGGGSNLGVYASDLVTGGLVGLALGGCCGLWAGLFRDGSARRAGVGAAFGAGIGLVGGMIGLVIGEAIFGLAGGGLAPRALGWGFFGAFVGSSEGLAQRMWQKLIYGAYGGFLGGLIGGSTYEWLFGIVRLLFERTTAQAVGGAIGLVLLGMFIGGFVGLVEDLLREAWLVFTSGKLEGQTRTLDATQHVFRIGRSDLAEICILGDANLAAKHARIVAEGGQFVIEAVEGKVQISRDGKWLSITAEPLRNGDLIQIGSSRAQFYSRSKRR